VAELIALGKPALFRLLDVFNNKVSVPRGPSDRHASIGRDQALTRLVERHPDAVLEYFKTHNSLSPALNGVLSASGDQRLMALAAQATKQHGWVKLPEFGSTAPLAQQSPPHVAVDQAELDRLIQEMGLGSDEAIEKIEKVVAFGEPALRRLIEVYYGDARIPRVGDPRDPRDNATDNVFARLVMRHPDLTLELVRGRGALAWPIMAGLRSLDNERFKMIADIASKNFGHVEGLTHRT
jgi:hypothetical protein